MRKIEQQMVKALKGWKNWQLGNTRVKIDEASGIREVYLHNNRIVQIQSLDGNGLRFEFATCGWTTRTTMSRLNSVAEAFNTPVRFGIKNFSLAVYVQGDRLHEPSDPFPFEQWN